MAGNRRAGRSAEDGVAQRNGLPNAIRERHSVALVGRRIEEDGAARIWEGVDLAQVGAHERFHLVGVELATFHEDEALRSGEDDRIERFVARVDPCADAECRVHGRLVRRRPPRHPRRRTEIESPGRAKSHRKATTYQNT